MRLQQIPCRSACPPGFEVLEPRLLLAGDVYISELMAVNGSTVADENGDFSDWIEVHNPTGEDVDLTGWRLADSDAEWAFPSMTLPAGERLMVFASDKNRRDPAGELHTNFKLSSGGEYVALLDETGTVVHAFAPKYPDQL